MRILMYDRVAKGKVPRFQISRAKGWHACVCFSTNVYGLYARGDFTFISDMATIFIF